MGKLLFILLVAGAFTDQLASSRGSPPLLIDASPSAPLDAAR